jgi:A/G-specific adenine glycosylase
MPPEKDQLQLCSFEAFEHNFMSYFAPAAGRLNRRSHARTMRLPMGSVLAKSHFVDSATRSRFRNKLLRWYDDNKRDLPWRKDRDPYRVWISETMLQQTRVAAVIAYYESFVQRFPGVTALARSRTDQVLAAWSGLGYYRRARALHEAAKEIVSEHDGEFPRSIEGLRALPGIGRYTAAAIASIAFNEPVAVVDGNVERVLKRVCGGSLAKDELWEQAGSLLSRRRPGDFNQALMELGATVCLPRAPQCLLCPIAGLCQTRGELPAPAPEVRRKLQIHYTLNLRDNAVLLVRRPKRATLMPDMWELPEFTARNSSHQTFLTLRHSITVTDYTVFVLSNAAPAAKNGRWIERNRLAVLPLTGLARKILHKAEII